MDLNVAVLRGRLTRPAELRLLPVNGQSLVYLELTTRRADVDRAEVVPVIWPDAPAAAQALDAGDEVLVVGHVARRFFRAGGATQSRTEVVASVVIPVLHSKRGDAALRQAADELLAGLKEKA